MQRHGRRVGAVERAEVPPQPQMSRTRTAPARPRSANRTVMLAAPVVGWRNPGLLYPRYLSSLTKPLMVFRMKVPLSPLMANPAHDGSMQHARDAGPLRAR